MRESTRGTLRDRPPPRSPPPPTGDRWAQLTSLRNPGASGCAGAPPSATAGYAEVSGPRLYRLRVPELPEVETVRLGLLRVLVGQRVTGVRLGPHPVVRAPGGGRRDHATPAPERMLRGSVVVNLHRHGKQLAIEGSGGPAVWVHLGMSGQLRFTVDARTEPAPPHTHATWALASGAELRFVDPRRFGGLATHAGMEELRRERFAAAGPDALGATPARLHAALRRTGRPLKAALLDQAVLAGLGNIYADECCHAAGLSPHRPASSLTRAEVQRLVRAARRILKRAVSLGGSTLRDHADTFGNAGTAQTLHRVYGRGGEPCLGCGAELRRTQVAQRTTVHCPACQP